jgi:hypothetical protein
LAATGATITKAETELLVSERCETQLRAKLFFVEGTTQCENWFDLTRLLATEEAKYCLLVASSGGTPLNPQNVENKCGYRKKSENASL